MTHFSRRTFLAGAAVALASRPAWAQDKVLLGTGTHQYEWVPGWAKLPEGMKNFGNTHGSVVVDSKDRIFVNTDTEHAVMIFDADGKFIKSWGKDFRGGAHGMTIAKEGDKEVMWLAHTGRHEVVKTTLDGEVLQSIGVPEQAGVYQDKNKYLPTDVAIAPNGDVYVGDGYGMHWVHRWNAKGEYVQSWRGGEGDAGKFKTPHGIWIDVRKDPATVIVADRGNSRLQIFTLDGKPLGIVKEGLRNPCKVQVRNGDVLIPDLKGRVTILDKDNKLIAHIGENSDKGKQGNHGVPPDQWKDGEFTAPHGAAWDSKGNLYVQDWNATGRVSKLKRV